MQSYPSEPFFPAQSLFQGQLTSLHFVIGEFLSLPPSLSESFLFPLPLALIGNSDVSYSVSDGENGFWDDIKCGTENKDTALVCGEEKRGQKKMRKGEEKVLTFEEVSHCFYMPIRQAAKELNVGVTLLKKSCRKLGIPRWPHRKLKSLQTLVKNVKVRLEVHHTCSN